MVCLIPYLRNGKQRSAVVKLVSKDAFERFLVLQGKGVHTGVEYHAHD